MKKCYFCKKSFDLYEQFDECFPICHNCFRIFLMAGLLKECSDDMWHFKDDKVSEILC